MIENIIMWLREQKMTYNYEFKLRKVSRNL